MRAYRYNKNPWSLLPVAGLWASLIGVLPTAIAANPQPAMAHVVTAPWAATQPKPKVIPEIQFTFEPQELVKAPPPPPLTAEQQAIVQATKPDKLPEPTWLRYVLSNEWRHDVLFSKISGLGGVYIGVATDQNYTMAAAARSELLVLMDYDSEVVAVHRIYHALMKAAPTIPEFRAFFKGPNAVKAGEVIATAAPNKAEAQRLVQIWNRYRDRMGTYLYHVANTRVGNRHPTWLGDPEAYGYIRGLVMGGRVLAIQGDLNGPVAIKSIGDTARALKLPVRIFYTSNAEGFFKYSQAFRDNLASLPHDEKSVMIRTYKRGMSSPLGDDWHYNVHQINDFLERLALPGYNNIHRVMQDLRAPAAAKIVEPLGVSYYDGKVPRS